MNALVTRTQQNTHMKITQLNLLMEVYYASKTDINEKLVSQLRHHGSTVTYVKDVHNLLTLN